MRSIAGVRYSPGPFRTLGIELPADARASASRSRSAGNGRSTDGTPRQPSGGDQRQRGRLQRHAGTAWAASTTARRDSRITDSLLGLEYDAGCWIGRLVAERLSTGRSEATTRLMLQLELVGLSRLGSNPLWVLKDNIPGYRLLREEPHARVHRLHPV